ncbi:SusE domain-containing protein [Ferruginibacter sp.]
MKKMIKNISVVLVAVILFSACKKQIAEVQYLGGTAPVLTASSTSATVLNIADKLKTAITFTWTNPNYQFTTGISSQDVVYTLQVDTTGANFKSANLKEMVISKDLSVTLTVGDYNNLFASWAENMPHNFEFRIRSTLGNGAVPLYSNVVKIVVTPYLDVAVPLPVTGVGNLYLIGSATPGGDAHGWDNPVPAPPNLPVGTVSQQFTKTSSTTFEITIPLIGGKEYLVIPDNGSWANKYAVKKADVTSDGGPFGYNYGDNFPGPSASGNYKIVLNFKTGKFTVTKI